MIRWTSMPCRSITVRRTCCCCLLLLLPVVVLCCVVVYLHICFVWMYVCMSDCCVQHKASPVSAALRPMALLGTFLLFRDYIYELSLFLWRRLQLFSSICIQYSLVSSLSSFISHTHSNTDTLSSLYRRLVSLSMAAGLNTSARLVMQGSYAGSYATSSGGLVVGPVGYNMIVRSVVCVSVWCVCVCCVLFSCVL